MEEQATMHRQGDLLFIRVEELPAHTKKGSKVLREGEVTGHLHQVATETAEVRDLVRGWGEDLKFVVAEEETQITHDEHGTIVLAPGIWQVVVQREYEPLSESRLVND